MKKISIILASLFAALILASCAPISSFTDVSEEGQANTAAYLYSLDWTIALADADGNLSGSISGKGDATIPEKVTLTVAADKTVAASKTVSIKVNSATVYSATTSAELAAGDTIELARADSFAKATFAQAATGNLAVTIE